MAPASSSRWSDQEHLLLVSMTNDQLELETRDLQSTVSWIQHWKNVSARLQGHGHQRTPYACQCYWKRTIEFQKVNEEAAGPRWDNREHQILVTMTEAQLELEKANPLAVIPWLELWERVSQSLSEKGYTRSLESCQAYWNLIPLDSLEPTENSSSGASNSSQPCNGNDEANGSKEKLASNLGPSPAQKPDKPWSSRESESFLRLMMQHPEMEHRGGLDELSDMKLWSSISESHRKCGFNRSWEDCQTYWASHGTDLEAFNSSIAGMNVYRLKRVSATHDEPLAASESYVHELPVTGSVDNTNSNWGVPSHRHMSSSGPYRFSEDSQIDGYGGSAMPERRNIQAEDNQDNLNLQPLFRSYVPREPSRKRRCFRFGPDQRALLHADAINNGYVLDNDRRAALAKQLGVDEISIKNWFTRQRHRSSIETPVECTNSQSFAAALSSSTARFDGHDGDRQIAPCTVDQLVEPLCEAEIEYNTRPPISKRPRLEDINSHETVGQSRSASVIQHENTKLMEQMSRHYSSNLPEMNSNGGHAERNASSNAEREGVASEVPHTGHSIGRPVSPTSIPGSTSSATVVIETISHDSGKQADTAGRELEQIGSSSSQNNLPRTAEDDKGWASRRVKKFQIDILQLEIDGSRHTRILSEIEQEVEGVREHKSNLVKEREKEIANVLRDIEARYCKEHEALKEREELLNKSRLAELNELKKIDGDRARNIDGLQRYQAVVDYCGEERGE